MICYNSNTSLHKNYTFWCCKHLFKENTNLERKFSIFLKNHNSSYLETTKRENVKPKSVFIIITIIITIMIFLLICLKMPISKISKQKLMMLFCSQAKHHSKITCKKLQAIQLVIHLMSIHTNSKTYCTKNKVFC